MSRYLEPVVVSAVAVGAAAWFTFPVWHDWSSIPLANDWDGHLLFWTATAETLARYHQMPLWSPWGCGGMPLMGNPEAHVLTPFILLDLIFGVVAGVKLEIVLHLALLAGGGYVLGRSIGLSPTASAMCGLVPAWSSALPLHLGTGHTWALAYAYVPWVMWLALRAVERRRLLEAAMAGAVLGLMVNEGGTYPAPHTALLLAVVLVSLAALRRDLGPLAVLGAAAAWSIAIAAPHLFTTFEVMKGHPRLLESTESTSWQMVFRALFGLNQDHAQPMPTDRWYWGFHEYGAYLGPVAGVLALVGALWGGVPRRPFVLGAVVFLLLGMGDFGDRWAASPHPPFSPWALLHKLPLFASQRVPSRFLAMLGVPAGVLGGLGLDALIRRFGPRARVLGWILLALGAWDASLRGPPNYNDMYSVEGPQFPRSPTFVQFNFRPPGRQFASIVALSNRGALNCWDQTAPQVRAIGFNQRGYRGEQFLDGPGTVSLTEWTPNALTFHVEAPGPTVLVVNQNFDDHWTLERGMGEVVPDWGRLGARLPAGSQDVVLRYRCGWFDLGLVMLIIGLGSIGGLAVRAKTRGTSSLGMDSKPPATSPS